MAPHNTLVCHSQNPHPPWRDFVELFWQCQDIVLFLASTTPVISDSPSALAHLILWRLLKKGITLVEVFGGIATGLTAVLEVSLTVRRYVYVDNYHVSTHLAHHHFHQLMVLYPQQLHMTAIHGCFVFFLRDVSLISEANLQHLGPVDMVIVRWPC